MALNVTNSAEKTENSYSALSYLTSIDDENNELVSGSKSVNKFLPKILRTSFGLSFIALSIPNLVTFFSRLLGNVMLDRGFWRLNGFDEEYKMANHISDAVQVVVPCVVGINLLNDSNNEEQKKSPDHYLKKLVLDSIETNNAKNKPTVININNYYNAFPS